MVLNSLTGGLAPRTNYRDVQTLVFPVFVQSFLRVFCRAGMQRALPQEVLALFNVLRVLFVSKLRLAVFADKVKFI
jgi:hypothetical protein